MKYKKIVYSLAAFLGIFITIFLIIGGVFEIKFDREQANFVSTMFGVLFAGISLILVWIDSELKTDQEVISRISRLEIEVGVMKTDYLNINTELIKLTQRVGSNTGRLEYQANFLELKDTVNRLKRVIESQSSNQS